MRSAVGTDGGEVGDVEAREEGIGGGGLQILRQAQAGDVEAHAQRRQFRDPSRVAGAELADQVRRKRVRVAQRGRVGDAILIAAAVGPLARKRDVGVWARAGRSLVAIAEEELVAVAEVVVGAHEPPGRLNDAGEVLRPVDVQRGRNRQGGLREVGEHLLHDRVHAAGREQVAREHQAAIAAVLARVRSRGERIVDADQGAGTGQGLREIAAALQRGGHVGRRRAHAVVVGLPPVEEEEGLIAAVINARQNHRARERETVVVAPLPAARHLVAVVGPTVRIQLVVPQIVVGAAVKLVAARAAGGHDHAARRAPVFGREAVGDETHFLHRLLRGRIGVVEGRVVPRVLAVEQDGGGIGAAAADDGPGARVAGGNDAGRKREQRIRAAAGGQLDELGGADDVAQRRAHLLDTQGVRRHGHLLLQAARLERGVDGRDLADQHRHVRHLVGGEPGALHHHAVLARRKVGDLVVALLGGFRAGDRPGGLVRGAHLHLPHGGPAGIHHRSGNAASLHLAKAGQGDHNRQQGRVQENCS